MRSFRAFLAGQRLVPIDRLDRALQRQNLYGDDLAVNLLEMGAVTEEDLTRHLGFFHGMPVVTRSQIEHVPAEVTEIVAADLAVRHRACPVADHGGTLVVAAARQLPPQALADLEQATGRAVSQAAASPIAVAQGLRVHYGAELSARYLRLIERIDGEAAVGGAPAGGPDDVAPRDDSWVAGKMPALRGRVIADKYRLLRRVGEGPSGTVYEARNVIVDRRFAVKILHRHLADDVDLVRRFVCDSMTAAAIRHPGIAAVYEAGVANDGAPFLVGELLDGDNLAACAGGGRQLAAAWVADVAGQVLGALAAAHAAGVVHGDIKPSNVHLPRRPCSFTVAKLVDFGSPGAVRSAGAVPTGPAATDLAGINCTAPERLLGGREADRRSDLYAVGVVMYECLTGRRPFEGSDEREVTARILAGRFPRPIDLNPALPIGLDLLVLRMMAGDPGERPATAEEAIAALARFVAPEARTRLGLAGPEPQLPSAAGDRVEGEPGDVPAEPHETPVPVPSPRPSPLWRRSAPLAAAAMAGALAGAAVFLAVSRDQVPEGRTAAERPAPQPVVAHDAGVVVIEVRLPGHEPFRKAVVPGRDRYVEVAPVPLAKVAGDDVRPVEVPPPHVAEAPARPPHVGPAAPAPPSRSSPAAPTVVAVAAPAPEPARQPGRAAVPPLSRVAAVAPGDARRDPAPPAPARLSVISSPWSYVTVDDSPTGRRTPLVNLEVPAGVRRVCLETSDGRRHCTAIRAEPGRAARVSHTFR